MNIFVLTYRNWTNGIDGADMFIITATDIQEAKDMAEDEGKAGSDEFISYTEFDRDSPAIIATVGVSSTDF